MIVTLDCAVLAYVIANASILPLIAGYGEYFVFITDNIKKNGKNSAMNTSEPFLNVFFFMPQVASYWEKCQKFEYCNFEVKLDL